LLLFNKIFLVEFSKIETFKYLNESQAFFDGRKVLYKKREDNSYIPLGVYSSEDEILWNEDGFFKWHTYASDNGNTY
jgi:hypothetical protein